MRLSTHTDLTDKMNFLMESDCLSVSKIIIHLDKSFMLS